MRTSSANSTVPSPSSAHLCSLNLKQLLMMLALILSVLALSIKSQALTVSYTTNLASPQKVNTTITITASSDEQDILYCFRVGYYNDGQWTWTTLQAYSADNDIAWTPVDAFRWTIAVWAKRVGSLAEYDTYKSGYFVTTIGNENISFTADPNPGICGQEVYLGASVNVLGSLMYWFRYGYQDQYGAWIWTDIGTYSAGSICLWYPPEARRYVIAVYVKTEYSPNQYDAYKSMYYYPKVNSVALLWNPGPRQKSGTSITLTATPGCTGTIEYKFKAGYNMGGGVYNWSFIRDYSTNPSCQWIPNDGVLPFEPYTYTVVVYARTVGDGSSYDTYDSAYYAINTPPQGNFDYYTIDEDPASPASFNVLANDIDAENDALSISAIRVLPQHGVAAINGNNIEYTPSLNYNGLDMIEYELVDIFGDTGWARVYITVNPVNDPPMAIQDYAYYNGGQDRSTDEFLPLINDFDVDGDEIQLVSMAGASNGQIVPLGGGSTAPKYKYIPNSGFTGTEIITYTIQDPSGLQSSATITICQVPDINIDDSYIASDDIPIPVHSSGIDVEIPLNINGLQKLQYCSSNGIPFWIGLKSSNENDSFHFFLDIGTQLIINTSYSYLFQTCFMVTDTPKRIDNTSITVGSYGSGQACRYISKYSIPNMPIRSAKIRINNLFSAIGYQGNDTLHLCVFDQDINDTTYPDTPSGNQDLFDAIGTTNQ